MAGDGTTRRGGQLTEPADRVIDLTDARRRRAADAGDEPDRLLLYAELLERVTVVLNSTLQLDEILHGLARIALDASGAARCSLFLVEDDRLTPAVALGRVTDLDLASAFREMDPIRTSDVRTAWERICDARVVVVDDARQSTLLPAEWVERFDLHAVVAVALIVGDEVSGVMVVDYPDGDRIGDLEVRVLETLTRCAAIAVGNARLHATAERRAAAQEVLARCAAALVDVDSPTAFAETLVEGYARLLGIEPCAIGLFDAAHTRLTTLAVHGHGPTGPIPMATVPPHVVERLTEAWERDPTATVTLPPEPWFASMAGGLGAARYRIVPLTVAGIPRGCVVLGESDRPVRDPESLAAAEALRDLATAALERTILMDRIQEHARRLEALFAASNAVVAGGDAGAVAARLHDLLLEHDIRVTGLVLADPALAERFGAERPDAAERAAWRADESTCVLEDGTTSVAMRLDGRTVGALRVEVDDDPERLAFLDAVGRGVAEVLARAALRASLDDAARKVALADERERIAADLHDTAGQLLVAIGLLGRRAADRLPRNADQGRELARIAELADSGKWEIDQAVRALTHVPAGDHGLREALADLAQHFQDDSGIQVLVEVRGTERRLSAPRERALYRVAHEALSNAWRHARAAAVRVCLEFGDEVRLTVADDGVGLAPGRHQPGVGLLTVRRALEQAGGVVVVTDTEPHGVLVDARVPGDAG